MSFSIGRWFQETIIERTKRILWTRFAAEMETEALLDYAAQLNRIEEQAAEYEAGGNLLLAQILRSRAAEISPENPIAGAERAAKLLSEGSSPVPALPAPEAKKTPKQKLVHDLVVGRNRRGRPKKPVVKQQPSPPTDAVDSSAPDTEARGD